MRVFTRRIEERFGMGLSALRRAVAAAPHASPEAVEAVRWHGLLATAQSALERAEDALVAVLDTSPTPADLVEDHERVMLFASRVNEALGIRDGRATVLRFLLDPDTPGTHGPAAWRGAVAAHRRGNPALPTTTPTVPHAPSALAPVRRGKAR
ncbi:hypothetical protein GTW66_21485 [Streptomyces sp. SID5473]|uniref:Uncharacterized protein n=2 Tax=Streptomyces TaxID=1883 RepID=A0A7G3ULU1_STRT9|nr:hypothetical protein [Streptomyces sp. SID5473]MYS66495.1 hypothetical protein [Streptomyces sp. SID5473]QKM71433.1 hypothetical protein STSU_007060 [Streptomyces tsukubensis NRRL18488]TAI41607.1 hypothetical protein EWI31_27390 [Streptomyces tsukubensis]